MYAWSFIHTKRDNISMGAPLTLLGSGEPTCFICGKCFNGTKKYYTD
jgi:hypothetical protein